MELEKNEVSDPIKEKKHVEDRLREISEMPYLDTDVTEERRVLERKLENLRETVAKGF